VVVGSGKCGSRPKGIIFMTLFHGMFFLFSLQITVSSTNTLFADSVLGSLHFLSPSRLDVLFGKLMPETIIVIKFM